jgi:hypothetical protein
MKQKFDKNELIENLCYLHDKFQNLGGEYDDVELFDSCIDEVDKL